MSRSDTTKLTGDKANIGSNAKTSADNADGAWFTQSRASLATARGDSVCQSIAQPSPLSSRLRPRAPAGLFCIPASPMQDRFDMISATIETLESSCTEGGNNSRGLLVSGGRPPGEHSVTAQSFRFPLLFPLLQVSKVVTLDV